MPATLGGRVSAALRIPVVGIGAGPDCDAQIMVWQDMAMAVATARGYEGIKAASVARYHARLADLGQVRDVRPT